MFNEKELMELWEAKKVEINNWTNHGDTPMFIDIIANQNIINHFFNINDYNITDMGNNRFIIQHKKITESHKVWTLVEHMHADDSVKYKGCVEIMSKMTAIEGDMKRIKEHFPLASIIDVEQAEGCWKNNEYYTIKLGEPIF